MTAHRPGLDFGILQKEAWVIRTLPCVFHATLEDVFHSVDQDISSLDPLWMVSVEGVISRINSLQPIRATSLSPTGLHSAVTSIS